MDELLKYINDSLVTLALELTGYNHQDAKDLVQDTCLKVITKYDSYFKDKDFDYQKRVVRVCMRNLFLDSKRRYKCQKRHKGAIDYSDGLQYRTFIGC